MESDREKFLKLEERLGERVVGQKEAIEAVAEAVRRSRAGLGNPSQPIGSFIFVGPTGVGKTELAKALAATLFDDESRMIRVDMSEYMEKHAVARLIGAPPGYVGYEEGGYLTERARRQPYSVILLDEIEKAHPDVFNILLQILDDGRLTDGQGRTVDFTNTVVIMTSNLGTSQETFRNQEEMRESVMRVMRSAFKPEFLNRIDDVIVFHPLGEPEMESIARLQVDTLKHKVAERGLSLQIDAPAMQELARRGFDPVYGARPLKRLIQREIEGSIARAILSGDARDGDTLRVTVKDHEFHTEVVHGGERAAA
jgi:ATP-dependent Clp protease ATP-binding subunit ClpB